MTECRVCKHENQQIKIMFSDAEKVKDIGILVRINTQCEKCGNTRTVGSCRISDITLWTPDARKTVLAALGMKYVPPRPKKKPGPKTGKKEA